MQLQLHKDIWFWYYMMAIFLCLGLGFGSWLSNFHFWLLCLVRGLLRAKEEE